MDKKKFKGKRGMLLYFLEGSKGAFLLCVLCAGISTLFDLVSPKIIGFTVDSVIGDRAAELPAPLALFIERLGGIDALKGRLWLIAIAVMVIALLGAFFRYLFRLFNSIGAETFVKTMRDRLFSHIEHLPFSWYMENQTGDIIQRCTSDVDTVKRFLSEQLTSMFRIVIMLVLSLWFMSTISGALTLFAAAFIPVIVLYSMFFHNRISNDFLAADEEEGRLSTIAQENLTGVRVVRAFGRERYERDRFEAQNKVYTGAYMKLSILMSAFWTIGDFISGLQVLTVVALGAVYAVRGSMTAGDYIAFISYNTMLVWPIRSLGRVISDMSKAGVSIDRIRYIMDSREEHDRPGAIDAPIDRDIEFDHVSFRYTPDTPLVLDDVSFRIKAGSTFGILGGTGSGKSTLMYLLARLYPLEEGMGHIRIGGVDIADIRSEWLRDNVGLALQEPYLFSRSLADNISIAKDGATIGDIRKASRIASLDETATHFTQGYDTFVGERGVTLSGGQKQRASIAQMVIRRTPVMVFDDSLSAVDAETDARIRESLQENLGGSTVVLISHRITTLMRADDIIVLNHGRIAEEGSHEELLRRGGIYSRICGIQQVGGGEGDVR